MNQPQSKIKYHLIKLGHLFLAAMSFLMITTFLYAYFNNGKVFFADINSFGEATIELIIVLFAVPCILLAIADTKLYLDSIKKSFKKEKELIWTRE